jgi:hypothetical protein
VHHPPHAGVRTAQHRVAKLQAPASDQATHTKPHRRQTTLSSRLFQGSVALREGSLRPRLLGARGDSATTLSAWFGTSTLQPAKHRHNHINTRPSPKTEQEWRHRLGVVCVCVSFFAAIDAHALYAAPSQLLFINPTWRKQWVRKQKATAVNAARTFPFCTHTHTHTHRVNSEGTI